MLASLIAASCHEYTGACLQRWFTLCEAVCVLERLMKRTLGIHSAGQIWQESIQCPTNIQLIVSFAWACVSSLSTLAALWKQLTWLCPKVSESACQHLYSPLSFLQKSLNTNTWLHLVFHMKLTVLNFCPSHFCSWAVKSLYIIGCNTSWTMVSLKGSMIHDDRALSLWQIGSFWAISLIKL